MRFWSSKSDNAICYSKDLKHFIIKENQNVDNLLEFSINEYYYITIYKYLILGI